MMMIVEVTLLVPLQLMLLLHDGYLSTHPWCPSCAWDGPQMSRRVVRQYLI
jgi:hypothetical protein